MVDHPPIRNHIEGEPGDEDPSRVIVEVPAPDDPRWSGTASTDSIFITLADTLHRNPFPGPGENNEDVRNTPFERWHTFFVRAVDNEGLADPTRALEPGTDDAVVVVFGVDSLQTHPPSRLLYRPFGPSAGSTEVESLRRAFLDGERLEFQDGNYAAAARAFGTLAESRDPAVRAGAYLRLARNQRKAGHVERALATYARLAELEDVRIDEVPAALLAGRARCSVLAALGRTGELRREATALHEDLLRGRWHLSRPVFELHADQLSSWLGPLGHRDEGRRALSATAEWLWKQWREVRTGGPPLPDTTTYAVHGRTDVAPLQVQRGGVHGGFAGAHLGRDVVDLTAGGHLVGVQ